jgi:hypothetical protein
MWVLLGYERFGDRLLSEQPLPGADADILREIWDRPKDDPMIFVYPATPTHIAAVQERLGTELTLDFEREDYFLDFDAWRD